MAENGIGWCIGAKAICEMLKVNTSLKELDLTCEEEEKENERMKE